MSFETIFVKDIITIGNHIRGREIKVTKTCLILARTVDKMGWIPENIRPKSDYIEKKMKRLFSM